MKGKLEPSERQKLFEEGKNLMEEFVTLEVDLLKLPDELQQEAQSIPKMTHPDVPFGEGDSSTVRKWYFLFDIHRCADHIVLILLKPSDLSNV
ncbi:hypothetical protein KY285_007470 [Solanum tuberosum]|nr:hypothetical protein KY289_007836 [Solanum tuberosum]KAH0745813.1 hypothetical protein KY285_007470 [Solanum tuberosum]